MSGMEESQLVNIIGHSAGAIIFGIFLVLLLRDRAPTSICRRHIRRRERIRDLSHDSRGVVVASTADRIRGERKPCHTHCSGSDDDALSLRPHIGWTLRESLRTSATYPR